jgi:hypothetical protein
MSDSTRLEFAVQLRHQMMRHEHDVLASLSEGLDPTSTISGREADITSHAR